MPSGWTNKHRNGEDAEIFFRNTFPSIYTHLQEVEKNRKGSGKGLYNRDDQGQYWWELRSCVYMDIFISHLGKIMWAETIKEYFHGNKNFPRFSFDNEKKYLDKTCFMIVGKPTKFLLGILNSILIEKYLRETVIKLGEGSMSLPKTIVERIPIPKISREEQVPFENLVNEILEKKALGQDTQSLENEIDNLVFALYELTNEEIAFLEK